MLNIISKGKWIPHYKQSKLEKNFWSETISKLGQPTNYISGWEIERNVGAV